MEHLPPNEISLNIRLASITIDHAIMLFICFLTAIPSLFLVEGLSPFFSQGYDYMAFAGPTAYFCKDIFGGRSPGKRILRLQVVCNQERQVVTPEQSIIRNVFCIIWPVELIVSMCNPHRRIGDHIAGTRLTKFNMQPLESNIKVGRLAVVICLTYLLLILIAVLILKY
jgi:uncharacterized RDD family membrane protein YckC